MSPQDKVSRRHFATRASGAGMFVLTFGAAPSFAQKAGTAEIDGRRQWLPQADRALAQEMVGVAHSDVKRVRELLELHPALANAAIDWGFGDWEDALGAASHTGRREIAELLLAHGARISIFAAAMLGYLDIVRAFITTRPGMQRTLGPHGITLLAHARAGGAGAVDVVKYLESVGDADTSSASQPLEVRDRDAVVGRYIFGADPRDRFEVAVRKNMFGAELLEIERPGSPRKVLIHAGSLVFFPSGVPSVKIAFARAGELVTQLTIADPDVFLTAKRQ